MSSIGNGAGGSGSFSALSITDSDFSRLAKFVQSNYGIDLSQILRPRLTTLKQNADLMGSSAARELVQAVEQGKDYIPRRIIIPGQVLPGETVGRAGETA